MYEYYTNSIMMLKIFTSFDVNSSVNMEVNLVISEVIKLLSHSSVNLIYFQFMMS